MSFGIERVELQTAEVCSTTGALKMFTRRGLLLVSTILLCIGSVGLIAQSAAAQSAITDGPDANPGRPTVSTPATLTPVGYLQFETGVLGATLSPEFSTRYGFDAIYCDEALNRPSLGVFLPRWNPQFISPLMEIQRMEWARSFWALRQ